MSSTTDLTAGESLETAVPVSRADQEPTGEPQIAELAPAQPFRDLAPTILRQRLVVEGYPDRKISAEDIKEYLSQVSRLTEMVSLMEPMTHASPLYGWAGWIHWETSGAHFYAWDEPLLFFSVDIYTCKAFDPAVVVEYTRRFFGASELVFKEF